MTGLGKVRLMAQSRDVSRRSRPRVEAAGLRCQEPESLTWAK